MFDDRNQRGTLFVLEGSNVRVLLLATLFGAVVLALTWTPAALTQETSVDEAHAQEEAALLDCSDFATKTGAQALFSLASEDRFRLDRDDDGMACETQGRELAEDGTRLGSETGEDLDCMDFLFQEAAQAHLKANPSDPYGLDPESNGIACDIRPADYENSATDLTLVSEARSDADLDCEDFEYQQEAQMVLFRNASDPNSLDEDGNGYACEDIPFLASNSESIEAVQAEPSTAPALLALAQYRGSGFGFLLDAVALLLVASGVLALVLAWRWHPTRSE